MQIKTLNLEGKKSFSLLAGINRPILPAQVTKLSESINKMDVIRPVIVTTVDFINGKPTTYIIDGQHLFHACIRNKKDIPYISIEVKDTKDLIEKIALLNSSSKSWKLEDYITAWSYIKDDYKKLARYFTAYGIRLNFLATVLQGGNIRTDGGNHSISNSIKRGNFAINNEPEAIVLLDTIDSLLKVINIKNSKITNPFIGEFIKFYKENGTSYNHEKLIEYIKNPNNKRFFQRVRTEEEIKNFLSICK
jgi:hypothetical protein